MNYQASPFLVGRFHAPDPHDDGKGYCWVSATLPYEMKKGTHSDEEIMLFVLRRCKAGPTAMTHQPMHGMGHHCLSLPIKWDSPRQNLKLVREQAAIVAEWWLYHIREQRIAIDQEFIFEDRNGPRFKNVLDKLPTEWGKPDDHSK
ncbi:hypothetical protein N7475_005131 [Penicillium sp. IBT 31633x]|nr:hypothetical protein N7475_005131 [Penicillium sp. IBT 31633x]